MADYREVHPIEPFDDGLLKLEQMFGEIQRVADQEKVSVIVLCVSQEDAEGKNFMLITGSVKDKSHYELMDEIYAHVINQCKEQGTDA